ncbi:MAG: hypothetical protein ACLGQX_06095 [Acidobacteriota bacterium]
MGIVVVAALSLVLHGSLIPLPLFRRHSRCVNHGEMIEIGHRKYGRADYKSGRAFRKGVTHGGTAAEHSFAEPKSPACSWISRESSALKNHGKGRIGHHRMEGM